MNYLKEMLLKTSFQFMIKNIGLKNINGLFSD